MTSRACCASGGGMADREQTRRDAESLRRELAAIGNGFASTLNKTEAAHLSNTVSALLAELEQAERERDEAREQLSNCVRMRAENLARLAKVPALVEAWEEARARLAEQTIHDALAYVEMRSEVLGTDDPLAVLSAAVREFQMLYPREALAAFEEPGVPS